MQSVENIRLCKINVSFFDFCDIIDSVKGTKNPPNQERQKGINKMYSYIASKENYKGFILEIEMTRSHDHPSLYHRRCNIYKSGELIGIAKTKKEVKDLIDHNAIK